MKNKTWPRIGKPIGEQRFGFSEEDELKEHCMGELMGALEAKDPKRFMDAVVALIEMVLSQEQGQAE